MGIGRFLCVSLPFGLTLCSLICLFIAALAGVTDDSLDLFAVNTGNLSISSSTLVNLEKTIHHRGVTGTGTPFTTSTAPVKSGMQSAVATATGTNSATNITAKDLGLADDYQIGLWGYCATTYKNSTCTKPKFNWAASSLNTTSINSVSPSTGKQITLPKDVSRALKTYVAVSKWTQVIYIIALVATGAELFLGLFAMCSRAASCVTYIISGFSTVAVLSASIMVTVLSSVTVASIKTTSKAYGVQASINTHFLSVTWLAVAFSIASSFFWVFTVCCCAASRTKSSKKERRSLNDTEKLIPASTTYEKLDGQETAYVGPQQSIHTSQPYKSTRTGSYEPYTHTPI